MSKKSGQDTGTMYQVKNLLNRTPVPLDPEKNMNASEDFLLLLLHAHVIAAAKGILSYDFTESESLTYVARSIVNSHVLLPESFPDEPAQEQDQVDGVNLYARELLTLSLVWHFFHDATREGDGDRIILCWKILLPIFKATNHRNYAKEAVQLLIQYNSVSERMKSQLLWSRCINTKGRTGCNIACDLHMEHLNRTLKTVLRSMGANITPKAIVQAGKSIAAVHSVCREFEQETCSGSTSSSDIHNIPSFGKDFETVLKLLIDENVMEPQQGRFHPSFTFKKGILQHYMKDELLKRIRTTMKGIF